MRASIFLSCTPQVFVRGLGGGQGSGSSGVRKLTIPGGLQEERGEIPSIVLIGPAGIDLLLNDRE